MNYSRLYQEHMSLNMIVFLAHAIIFCSQNKIIVITTLVVTDRTSLESYLLEIHGS